MIHKLLWSFSFSRSIAAKTSPRGCCACASGSLPRALCKHEDVPPPPFARAAAGRAACACRPCGRTAPGVPLRRLGRACVAAACAHAAPSQQHQPDSRRACNTGRRAGDDHADCTRPIRRLLLHSSSPGVRPSLPRVLVGVPSPGHSGRAARARSVPAAEAPAGQDTGDHRQATQADEEEGTPAVAREAVRQEDDPPRATAAGQARSTDRQLSRGVWRWDQLTHPVLLFVCSRLAHRPAPEVGSREALSLPAQMPQSHGFDSIHRSSTRVSGRDRQSRGMRSPRAAGRMT
jgi:hypothetical protein